MQGTNPKDSSSHVHVPWVVEEGSRTTAPSPRQSRIFRAPFRRSLMMLMHLPSPSSLPSGCRRTCPPYIYDYTFNRESYTAINHWRKRLGCPKIGHGSTCTWAFHLTRLSNNKSHLVHLVMPHPLLDYDVWRSSFSIGI